MSVRLSVLRFTESKNYFFVSLPSPNPIQRLEPANRNTEVHCQNGDVSILNAKNNTIHTTVISVQMVSFFQKYFCDV